MRRRLAAGGGLLLAVAVFLAAAALGPYLGMFGATRYLVLPVMLLVSAIVVAAAGVVLLNYARSSEGEDYRALAATVDDPHHPPAIRSPILPATSGHGGLAPIVGGVTGPKAQEDPRDRE